MKRYIPFVTLTLLLIFQGLSNLNAQQRHSTSYGYVEVGPRNTSWMHFITDRSKYYFDKRITVNEGIISSYDEDLQLQTQATTRMYLKSNGYVGVGTTNPKDRIDIHGGLRFNGNSSMRLTGETRSSRSTVVMKGHWDEFEVKGRVLEWTGSNLHIGFENNHSSHYIEMGRKVGALKFMNDETEVMRLTNGDVGIGTSNPDSRLHVVDTKRVSVRVGGPASSSDAVGDFIIKPSDLGTVNGAQYWSWSFRTDSWSGNVGDFVLYSNDGSTYISPIIAQSDGDLALVSGAGAGRFGKVGIGTMDPDEKLTVKGNIHAEEVKVDLNVPGPDYVFEEDYDLRSLEETKNYISENKHLPEIPSAKEMEENGISLGEMNMLLLKKIEELTLHQIELMERIEELEQKVQVKE